MISKEDESHEGEQKSQPSGMRKDRKVSIELNAELKHSNVLDDRAKRLSELKYLMEIADYDAEFKQLKTEIRELIRKPLEHKVVVEEWLDSNYSNLQSNKIYEIPERIELDYDFEYLIGAYAAEGCVTPHQISISNNDQDYFVPIQRLCKKFNITTKIYVHNDKGKVGWTSTDIRIYNTLLTQLVVEMSGRHSHNKKLSSHIVFSNRQ